jgi:hypothetical protein
MTSNIAHCVGSYIEEAIEEMCVTPEDRNLAALPPLPAEKPAVVKSVASLAEARAQGARLDARLIALKRRIVPADTTAAAQGQSSC